MGKTFASKPLMFAAIAFEVFFKAPIVNSGPLA
jgi:hypothetical protein